MNDTNPQPTEKAAGVVGRRGVLGAAGGALVAGGAMGFMGRGQLDAHSADANDDPISLSYPFRGEHQQGITTPAQNYMFTAAYNLTTEDLDEVRDLMGSWSVAAEQMMAGELVGGEPLANRNAAPKDTGEVWGYPPSALTITVGVGAGVFRTDDGKDRYGLAHRIPAVLAEGLPKFGNEALRSDQSGGDLIVQACANDTQVAMHAIRNLTRIAFGKATLKWTQVGHGRTASTSTEQETPRNLFGFKDGTNNIKAEDGDAELARHVWVAPEDDAGAWLAGGSYFVARKIRMRLETWDRLILDEQEGIIGRDKRYGAPLSVENPTSTKDEFTFPDFTAKKLGAPAIPVHSHIALVSPANNGGARMLRRGYNYSEGNDSLGQLNGGLFFVVFVRDPRENFYPVLHRMNDFDEMTEYIQHVATGLFAMLPGVQASEVMFGQKLFGVKGEAVPK